MDFEAEGWWEPREEETAAVYLNTLPFVTVKAFHCSIVYSTVSSNFGTTTSFCFTFTVFNKLAECWLEIYIVKATAIINHNSLAKGIAVISASLTILQDASTVRMSYSFTIWMPPAVIATVVVDSA